MGVRRFLAVFLAAAFACGTAAAQSPHKPLRVILPVSAGSGVDAIVRAASGGLARALDQPLVIENLPGAGGITGTAALVKAGADGSTIAVVSNNHVTNPSVYKELPFDPLADITPIAIIGATPFVLVVNPAKLPARNLAELVALLKAKPGAYTYASSGNGTIIHLAGAMFADEAGVELLHVPYKGVAPMVTDLLGGQVDLGVVALPAIRGYLANGALRASGICGATRTPAAPDLPTLAEQGLANYDVAGWFAVVGPAKLPAAQVARIHDAFEKGFADPEVREAMAKQGNDIRVGTPEAAAAFFRTEMEKYGKLARRAGIRLD